MDAGSLEVVTDTCLGVLFGEGDEIGTSRGAVEHDRWPDADAAGHGPTMLQRCSDVLWQRLRSGEDSLLAVEHQRRASHAHRRLGQLASKRKVITQCADFIGRGLQRGLIEICPAEEILALLVTHVDLGREVFRGDDRVRGINQITLGEVDHGGKRLEILRALVDKSGIPVSLTNDALDDGRFHWLEECLHRP